MSPPSTKKHAISALKKGAATYEQVIKKGEAKEACIREAQAAQAAQAVQAPSLALDLSTLGAARLQLQRLLADIDAHAREIKEMTDRHKKTSEAMIKNPDAWIYNLALKKPHEPLKPFVKKDGTAIESFLESAFSILIMDGE